MIPNVCNNSANYFVSNKLLFGRRIAGDCDVSAKNFVIFVFIKKKKKNNFIFGCCFQLFQSLCVTLQAHGR